MVTSLTAATVNCKGEVLGTATLNCNYESATKGWQTLTFALYEDSMDFTVRIINIPDANKDTTIRVRPYYVLSNGDQTMIVYDDAVSGSYNAALG